MVASTEDIKTAISAFAAGVSAFGALIAVGSILLSRKNWLESNRPIVTAYVDEDSSGEGITIFNLFIKNTGTRPATGVQLEASQYAISQLLEVEANPRKRESIEAVFLRESKVSVLHQNESLVTSFGLSTTNPSEKWLRYDSEIQVSITYQDLEGRKYISSVPIKLRSRAGFGGGLWQSPKV